MRLFNHISALLFTLLIISACSSEEGRLTNVSLIPITEGDSILYINDDDEVELTVKGEASSILRNDMFVVKQDGLYGYVDDDGEQILPAIYAAVTPFADGYAWVVRRDDYPGYINKKGELQFTLREAQMVEVFHEGLARFAVKSGKTLSYGFVDNKGEKVIKPIYNDAKHFSSGLAAVQGSGDKWGYINAQGEVFSPAIYDDAMPFNGEEAIVKVDGKWGIINADSTYIMQPAMENLIYDNGIYIAKFDGKWGWCKSSGEWIIEPQFDDAKRFFDAKLAPVLVGERWGYVSRDGEISIKPQFTNAFPFLKGMALVAVGDFYGFVDGDGRYVVNPQYGVVSEDYKQNASHGTTTLSTITSAR